ncbi:activating transcription factor 7-interacting protein 2 isoform X2 [Tachyglossus aculeatus]|nr:activating transcription factor 7-interacting protein 2 isoform X2 [Tachyglossus aculeatus]XP_038619146.1 activating transcription factor 7-interacting protein 2 isoform X2 [Tachyglossus aculeatus]XP_038619147.1 activating transcription factor 7-interacting protein 2 isoform X2 [Tachyglossus aculeatus]
MESSSTTVKKILKAKKTMPPSCRKQAKLLKSRTSAPEAPKQGDVQNNKKPLGPEGQSSYHKNLDIGSSGPDCKVTSVLPKRGELLSPIYEATTEALDKGSVVKKRVLNEQFLGQRSRSDEAEDPCGKLSTRDANETPHTPLPNLECEALKKKPSKKTKADRSPRPKVGLVGVPDDLGKMRECPLDSHSGTTGSKRRDAKENSGVIPQAENVTPIAETRAVRPSEATVNRNPDPQEATNKKTARVVSPVRPNESRGAVKTEESCRTGVSSSECASVGSPQKSTANVHSSTPKKRVFSGNKENNIKRAKSSEEVEENKSGVLKKGTVLEQIKSLIQKEICIVNQEIFDLKLKELNERVGKTQCRNKHEAIAVELLSKISRLDRRMKDALAVQKTMLEVSKLPQDTSHKAETPETVILNKQDSRKHRHREREQCLNQGPSKHLKDTQKTESIKTSTLSEAKIKVKAREKENKPKPLAKEKPICKPGNTVKVEDSTVTSNFNSKQTNTTSDSSKQMAQNSAQPVDEYAHLPPLPEPPSHFKLESRLMGTFPPQKPELKLKRVLKSEGIALSWNICKIDPKCAPVESYHLFICQGNTTGNCPSVWKKLGEIKALPLPMACTLSHFSFSGTYYFALRSKDIYGRYGPFCDIKSIPGSSEDPSSDPPGPP